MVVDRSHEAAGCTPQPCSPRSVLFRRRTRGAGRGPDAAVPCPVRTFTEPIVDVFGVLLLRLGAITIEVTKWSNGKLTAVAIIVARAAGKVVSIPTRKIIFAGRFGRHFAFRQVTILLSEEEEGRVATGALRIRRGAGSIDSAVQLLGG